MTKDERDTLYATHKAVIEMRTNCVNCQDKVKRHDKTLYGNGRIGIVTQVYLLMWILGLTSAVGVGWAIKAMAFGG